MPPADNTPDFDSMTPEEIMAWMESLAKRQGANPEELTTSADIDIPEIDPDSVVIDEPGYVPYGEERPVVPPIGAPPRASGETNIPPPRTPASFGTPSPSRPPTPPTARQQFSSPPEPADDDADAPEPVPVESTAPAVSEDAFAWLESLAAGQSDALFNIDLSAISDAIEPAPAKAAEPVDPMAWLKSLAAESEPAPSTETPSAPARSEAEATPVVSDPFAENVDPMAWLENLARRQGAKDDELTTNEPMTIPVPENPVIDEPGYTPFSFDSPLETPRARQPEVPDLEDPAKFLDSLAEAQGFGEERAALPEIEAADDDETDDIEAIEQAISSGVVSPEQMQQYLDYQTEEYVKHLGEPEEIPDLGEPVPADIPDWLLEQVGLPPEPAEEPVDESDLPPLSDILQAPPSLADMPEWLREDIVNPGALDLADIFADTPEDETIEPAMPDETTTAEAEVIVSEVDIDPTDPWVEAFELEQREGPIDITKVPEWYAENIADPERIAAVERQMSGEAILDDTALPEEVELPPGESEPLPAWMSDVAEAVESGLLEDEAASEPEPEGEEPATAAAIPDWLREAGSAVEPDAIPAWLTESLDEPETEAETIAAPETLAPPVAAPQPEPAPAISMDVSATVEAARARARDGDLQAALGEYESLIRQNRELDVVVEDLRALAKAQRGNAAVYRVLGDGLMRQGNLQAALDVYREALNQL